MQNTIQSRKTAERGRIKERYLTMKRCNIFLAAVLFFSVGIVSAVAEEPDDEDTRRETIYFLGNPVAAQGNYAFSQHLYDTAKISVLDETQSKYSVIAQTAAGDTPAADKNGDNTASASLGNALTTHRAYDETSIYDLSKSFEYSFSQKLGFTGQNDSDTASGSTEANAETSDNSKLSDNGAYSILVFEKKAFKNDQNRPQITGASGRRNGEIKKKEEFRSPVSAPFMMLVFLLCICIILVMSTTVGIKLKD